MEQGMTRYSNHRGFMLVTVLVVTAVGLLFGAGALLLFRYQCQLRIDRQHELEKVYAVRSALNYIRCSDNIVYEKLFKYHTVSERDLRLLVKPVDAIFPVLTNTSHFVMERKGDFEILGDNEKLGGYENRKDYEYGATGVENLQIRNGNGDGYGLQFYDIDAKIGAKWWVNIGMRGTGGWLESDYGRRYCFLPLSYVDGDTVKDVMRLCIIRDITNNFKNVGCKHGWPLSQNGEKALVFEVSPKAGDNEKNANMVLYEYAFQDGGVLTKELVRMNDTPSICRMGLQIAVDKVSIFYMPNDGGIRFSECKLLPDDVYRYFTQNVRIGSEQYNGVNILDGRVVAPELRAVFEVEACSDKRNPPSHPDNSSLDFLTEFKVTPAYQYDVFLEYPSGTTNLATVAQKTGELDRWNPLSSFTVITYDTHGTENKGFRKDEKDWAAKRRGGK